MGSDDLLVFADSFYLSTCHCATSSTYTPCWGCIIIDFSLTVKSVRSPWKLFFFLKSNINTIKVSRKCFSLCWEWNHCVPITYLVSEKLHGSETGTRWIVQGLHGAVDLSTLSNACRDVLSFTNFNKIFFRYFDPENVFNIKKRNNFRGDLTDVSAEKEPLLLSWKAKWRSYARSDRWPVIKYTIRGIL